MKRILCVLMLTALLFSLAACSDSGSKTDPSANSAVSSNSAANNNAASTAETTASAAPSADGVDIDLTAMSSTMVYSEVQNMQMHPENYLGKVVRMKGPFNVTEIEDNRYFACIIKDATACCSSGIEFVWAGDHSYPEDYPEQNAEITVTGTFTTYMEGSSKYLQLKDADLQF